MALPKAHRTQKCVNGVWYVRITLGRYAGAPVLGKYRGLSVVECNNAIADDAEGLQERYSAIEKGLPSLETIGGLLNAYERSKDFETSKSEVTKQEWSRVIKSMVDSPLGRTRASALKQPTAPGVITKWRDRIAENNGPRAADYRMEVLNAALNWHVAKGNIAKNAAANIEDVYAGDRSDLIWEPHDVEAYLVHIRGEIDRVWRSASATRTGHTKAKADSSAHLNRQRFDTIRRLANARDVLVFALNTGMRRKDISQLTWLNVRDGAIVYTPSKSRSRAQTSRRRKKARTVVIPLLPAAVRILARRREVEIGPRVFGSYTPKGIGDLVSDTAKAIGVKRTLHDAKGTFVTRLKTETDLTPQEIAEIVDWSIESVQSIIKQYVSGAAVSEALLKRFRTRRP